MSPKTTPRAPSVRTARYFPSGAAGSGSSPSPPRRLRGPGGRTRWGMRGRRVAGVRLQRGGSLMQAARWRPGGPAEGAREARIDGDLLVLFPVERLHPRLDPLAEGGVLRVVAREPLRREWPAREPGRRPRGGRARSRPRRSASRTGRRSSRRRAPSAGPPWRSPRRRGRPPSARGGGGTAPPRACLAGVKRVPSTKLRIAAGACAELLAGAARRLEVLEPQRGVLLELLARVPLHEREVERPPGQAEERHPDELLLEEETEERSRRRKTPCRTGMSPTDRWFETTRYETSRRSPSSPRTSYTVGCVRRRQRVLTAIQASPMATRSARRGASRRREGRRA